MRRPRRFLLYDWLDKPREGRRQGRERRFIVIMLSTALLEKRNKLYLNT